MFDTETDEGDIHIKETVEKIVSGLELPPTINEESSPLNQQDIAAFIKKFTNEGKNKDCAALLAHILKNMRFVSEQRFNDCMIKIADQIATFVGDEDYYICTIGETNSTGFMIDSIPFQRAPEKVLKNVNQDNEEVKASLLAGKKVVIVDDATYSGNNVNTMIKPLEKLIGKKLDSNQLLMCFSAVTSYAVERFVKRGYPNIQATYHFPSMKEIGGFDELFIAALEEDASEEVAGLVDDMVPFANSDYHLLSFFWQKIPDNFLPFLRRTSSFKSNFFLVDDTPQTGIFPSYKEKKAFGKPSN